MTDPSPDLNITSFSIPAFLRRSLPADAGDLALLTTAVHAVFLESGFVAAGGLALPEGSSPSAVVSISYAVPAASQPVTVKVSLVASFATVYGSAAPGAEARRICLDAARLAPAVAACATEIGPAVEREIFGMWRKIKDAIALPLLIDVCERDGLPPPPCFVRLPAELKVRVLELISGADLARIACVNKELRHLASNGDLWAKKIVEEFGLTDTKGLFGERWKDQFVSCWKKMKRRVDDGRRRVYHASIPPFWDRRVPFPSQRYNMFGGSYYGGYDPLGGLMHFPRRQGFSPNCNLGSFGH